MARNRLGHLVPPLIASAALACRAGEASGQSDRPSAANRLVKVWDFEDRVINGFKKITCLVLGVFQRFCN